jgi:hypothetical protein
MNRVKKNQLIQKYGPLVAEHLDRAMQAKAQGEYLKESIHKNLARDLRKKQLNEREGLEGNEYYHNPEFYKQKLFSVIDPAIVAERVQVKNLGHFTLDPIFLGIWKGGSSETRETIQDWAQGLNLTPPIKNHLDLVDWFLTVSNDPRTY